MNTTANKNKRLFRLFRKIYDTLTSRATRCAQFFCLTRITSVERAKSRRRLTKDSVTLQKTKQCQMSLSPYTQVKTGNKCIKFCVIILSGYSENGRQL